jgi:hypothetical protein
MAKVSRFLLAMVFLAIAVPRAKAFALLGPYTAWQAQGIGYQLPGDIGGPMGLNEGFRWNVPLITYGFDKTFIDYFGPEGVRAITEAMQIFNDLPAANRMSADLSEFSPQTLRENYEASALGIVDLKTTALTVVMEELGFADPVRFTFTLRGRETRPNPARTNYTTIIRNFDPVSLAPTRYVNGFPYTYFIREFAVPFDHADAIEEGLFSQDDLNFLPVATGAFRSGSSGGNSPFVSGFYRVGLTRDDVGGIRFLYNPKNYAVESLLPTVTAGTGRVGGGWVPFVGITNGLGVTNTIIGTNALGTNNILAVGVRGGKNKLRFQRAFFDPILGTFFTTISNAYTDIVVSTNREFVVQPVVRTVTQPDILFSAADLGLINGIDPVIYERTTTAVWINNDALNGFDPVDGEANGPGVIPPQVQITFTSILPVFFNSTANAFLDSPGEDSAFTYGTWGSFDGSTNAPIIFDGRGQLLSIEQLRVKILSQGAAR